MFGNLSHIQSLVLLYFDEVLLCILVVLGTFIWVNGSFNTHQCCSVAVCHILLIGFKHNLIILKMNILL